MPLIGILSGTVGVRDRWRADPVSEVSHEQKVQLLSGATATLFPITWREPFGLVMIESVAGTPVIGMGSYQKSSPMGKLVLSATLEKMIEAIPATIKLDRQTCRDYVLSRFSVQSTDEYEKVFQMSNLMAANTNNGHNAN